MNPRRHKSALLAVAILAALLLVWFLFGSAPRHAKTPVKVALPESTAPAPGPREDDPSPSFVDAAPTYDAEPDPKTAPQGTIVYRRAMLDDWRLKQGLPAVSPALTELENFRDETPEEARDPRSHALYKIDRDVHRFALLSEHEGYERERFLRDAEEVLDATWKARTLKAAEDHGQLAEKYAENVEELKEKRRNLVDEIVKAKQGVPR